MTLSKDYILKLHHLSVCRFGGAEGVRDHGLLDSAIARPFQCFNGKELYPTPVTKAAAIVESLLINHPFIDGNKRIGLLAMLVILKQGNILISLNNELLYSFIISISTGELKFEEIVEWLTKNSFQSA